MNQSEEMEGFDAQCSELFLYLTNTAYSMRLKLRFRCSMFWAFSLLKKQLSNEIRLFIVSMLNVLSFFFIAHSTTAMNKHLLRGISEEISPCALFIHFYHYTMINKAVENCSEKILKLKIISPLSLYKYL